MSPQILLYSESEKVGRLIQVTAAFLDGTLKREDEELLLATITRQKNNFEMNHDPKELLLSELSHTILKEFVRNESYVSPIIVERLWAVDDWGYIETFVAIYDWT